MSKKRKNVNNGLEEVIMQLVLAQGCLGNNSLSSNTDLDYIQKVEESGKQYEQEHQMRTIRTIIMLTQMLQDNQQELQEIRKYIKESQHASDARNSFEHDFKKEQKKQFKRLSKLQRQSKKQQAELKKCRKQVKQQAKTICFLAAYLNLGTISECNLSKIQKSCSKAIESQRSSYLPTSRNQPIIDVECWENKL